METYPVHLRFADGREEAATVDARCWRMYRADGSWHSYSSRDRGLVIHELVGMWEVRSTAFNFIQSPEGGGVYQEITEGPKNG